MLSLLWQEADNVKVLSKMRSFFNGSDLVFGMDQVVLLTDCTTLVGAVFDLDPYALSALLCLLCFVKAHGEGLIPAAAGFFFTKANDVPMYWPSTVACHVAQVFVLWIVAYCITNG